MTAIPTTSGRGSRISEAAAPPPTPGPQLPYRQRFDSIAEAERLARRKLPTAMFERINSGADDSETMRANIAAFSDVWFRPRAAAAAPSRAQSTTIAGVEVSTPVLLAPVGALRLQHPDGALAALAAASRARTVCAISPACGHRIDEIDLPAGAAAWYQVSTALGGREAVAAAIDEAKARGYAALVATVDSVLRPKAAPIRVGLSSVARFGPDLLMHPRWTFGFIRDGMRIGVANQAIGPGPAGARPLEWDDIGWIRKNWDGALVVKGVVTAGDALRALDGGADAIVVSNHGGLTLDGSIATLRALPEVVAAVGSDAEVLMDGGVRSGRDVVKALALGAKAVMIGRPYVMGLAVGGAAGVGRVLEILREDIDRALAFLGCASVAELGRDHVDVRF